MLKEVKPDSKIPEMKMIIAEIRNLMDINSLFFDGSLDLAVMQAWEREINKLEKIMKIKDIGNENSLVIFDKEHLDFEIFSSLEKCLLVPL